VVSGTEKIVHQANPWDALGHQAVEDFVVLFDQHAFVAAARVAGLAKARVSRPDRKREFAVLEQLAKAFDAWDRFDHRSSRNAFDNVAKSANDLRAVLGTSKGGRVLDGVACLASHLGALCDVATPSRHHVLDLLANAKRRKDEGRLDDAVARLYRAIEAVAQVALKERHGFASTEKVPLDRVPETLRREWAPKAKAGVVPLGLQDAYALLASLKDPLGEKFKGTALDGKESPLVVRNRSILAHGFDRVSERVFDKLWAAALSLAGVEEAGLPSWTILGERAER
jgi:CRISPR-associated protein (TIGR02710 family)